MRQLQITAIRPAPVFVGDCFPDGSARPLTSEEWESIALHHRNLVSAALAADARGLTNIEGDRTAAVAALPAIIEGLRAVFQWWKSRLVSSGSASSSGPGNGSLVVCSLHPVDDETCLAEEAAQQPEVIRVRGVHHAAPPLGGQHHRRVHSVCGRSPAEQHPGSTCQVVIDWFDPAALEEAG